MVHLIKPLQGCMYRLVCLYTSMKYHKHACISKIIGWEHVLYNYYPNYRPHIFVLLYYM